MNRCLAPSFHVLQLNEARPKPKIKENDLFRIADMLLHNMLFRYPKDYLAGPVREQLNKVIREKEAIEKRRLKGADSCSPAAGSGSRDISA